MLDEMRFFRSWMGNPLKTGAVSPSGPALTKRMAALVEPEREGPIVELGPGTGVVTKAILDRGIDPGRLILIEYNRDFCTLLKRRFPGVTVLQGDAYALVSTLGDLDQPIASIVSSLPLFTRPLPQRQSFIRDAMSRLEPGAPLIQFSYALVPPVTAVHCGCQLDKTDWIISNLPPARVWTYRRPEKNH
ncbi:MAG: phospholipid methyltransferase [Hyphomicrobiales bacterium]|nr:MAG: phospholipid methyltransferase [Hyphomicrobiales bacterium]